MSPCALFGKVPAAGDFLRLNLSAEQASRLDGWVAAELADLSQGDEGWREDFAAAPAWRFVASPDTAGPQALAGVIAPGRDRVGRLFPCVLVAGLQGLEADAAVASTPWFDRAEALLDRARAGAAVEALAADLAGLGGPTGDDLDVLSLRARSTEDGLYLDVRSGPDGRAVTLQAVLQATPLAAGASLWWRHTGAGARVMMTPGLPRREAFAALFRPGEAASGEAPSP